MKKLTAFLAAVALIACSADIYIPTANAMNTIGILDHTSQLNEDNAEYPDLESDYKTVTEGDFTFDVYEDFAFLTDYANRDAEEVEIPAEVNGIPVTGLINAPFGYCRKLKTITFPDSLQYFSWDDVIALKSVVHSSSSGANVIVGTKIEEIDSETTFNPDTFKSTIINSSPITITADEEENDFSAISEIKVSETNPNFTVFDGLLYSKDMTKLIGCPPALSMEELKISEKTGIINDYAFLGCYNLKKAVVPENIKQINNGAFYACVNLVSVELPKTINAVYAVTFSNCESLTDIKFNGEITKIGTGAFNYCESLSVFDIPETVDYIGSEAFTDTACIEVKDGIYYVDNWAIGCDEEIVNIIIEDGTIGVAEFSFVLKNNLELVDFPESVKYIGDIAIAGSRNKENIVHYRAPYINERTLAASKCTTDFYIYDKDCVIFDSEKTIPAQFNVVKNDMTDITIDGDWIINTPTIIADISDATVEEELENAVVIHGYAGSTAQAYAEKYNRKFVEIEEKTVELVAGDANGDGEFNIADAVTLQKWILGSSDAKLDNPDVVDFCTDGQIDVFDLCLMRERIVEGL